MSFKQTKKYVIYHLLPNEAKGYVGKVGATSNLDNRVGLQQGATDYGTDYVVLRETDDLQTASDTEIHFQKLFGYSVDKINFYDIMSKNEPKNEDVSGGVEFAFAKNGQWHSIYYTNDRSEVITDIQNAGVVVNGEQYDDEEVIKFFTSSALQASHWKGFYVSARAVDKFFEEWEAPEELTTTLTVDPGYIIANPCYEDEFAQIRTLANADGELEEFCHGSYISRIRQWATDRNLYEFGDPKTQYIKLQEEAGEVAKALLKDDLHEVKDGIGDMFVVLVNLAHLAGLTMEECIEQAWDDIKDRKGRMIDGTFVKEENLPENQ